MTRLGRQLGRGRLFRRQRIGEQPVWTLDWKGSDGRRHREALSTDKRAAEMKAAEIIRRRDIEVDGGAIGLDLEVAELLRLYLDDLRCRVVPRHLEQVTDRLTRVVRELKATRVRDITPIAMMQQRSRRIALDLGNRTVNLDLDVVRACLNWAVSVDLLDKNPLAKLKRLPEGEAHQRVRRRALSEDEIGRFIAAARADDEHQARRVAAEATIAAGTQSARYAAQERRARVPQAPMWIAFLHTGARWGELTRVTWADIDVDQAVLTLRAETTKAGKQRMIPLRLDLVAELVALQRVHEGVRDHPVDQGDRVFLTPSGEDWPEISNNAIRSMDRLLARAGIQRFDANGRKIDIHALRHSFASRCARRGVSLIHAQRLLGHSDPKLTAQIYSHVDVDDLREAMRGFYGM